MSTLASIVGGGAAAQQAGIQDDLENQANLMKNQVSQGTMAADIAKPGLQNLFTQAQTDTQQGLAQQQQAKGAEDQALVPSNIALGLSKNETQISSDKLQRMQQMGQIANQAASYMDNVPPAARPAAMNGLAQKFGIDVSQLGPLASGDPDQLRQFSHSLIQGTADYQTKMNEQELRNKGEETVEAQRAASSLANTKELVGGRTAVAGINADARLKNVQAVIGQLTLKVANGTATDSDRAALKYANDTQQLIRSGNPMASQLLGIDTQGNTPGVPQGGPQVPNTNPNAQTPPAAGNAVEAEMRRRGLLK